MGRSLPRLALALTLLVSGLVAAPAATARAQEPAPPAPETGQEAESPGRSTPEAPTPETPTTKAPTQEPAAAQEAGGAKEAEEAEPAPDPNRIRFQLPFPEERGGGTATGTAGSIQYVRESYVVLDGGVELRYQDTRLTARRVEADLQTQVVQAEGDVVIDQGPQRITGASALWNLESRTGTLTEATAYVDPDIYFSGAELSRVSENVFTVERGIFTSCSDEVPDWSFRVKRARVEVEGYAHIRGASMRVKKMPVLYTPYLLWPAKRERASGFLVPQPGYSNRRGSSLSLAYFQTLGRSWDTTLFADLYTEEFLGLGNELRWAPAEGSEGIFEGYVIRAPEGQRGPEDEEWRWKMSFTHATTNLPFGMRAVVSYHDYSDFDYLRDFERDFDRNSQRSIYSRGFATGNWGPHSLNLVADDRQTLITGTNTITQSRLPEIEYRLRPTRLGKLPLYLDLESSAAYLSVERSAAYDGSYSRFDALPNLTLPIRAWPWLSVSLNAGYRFTWYGDSLCQAGGEGDLACGAGGLGFVGESLSRGIPTAGVAVVGPSFSRIFDKKLGSFGKLKHIIEPRWNYSFFDDVDQVDQSRTPLFDEVDTVQSRNVGRFTLVNRLLAKPAEGEGAAREILSLEVSQAYSFDDTKPLQQGAGESTQEGPIDTLLRFEPGAGTSLKAQFSYNTQFDRLTSRSLSGSVGLGRHNVGLTWYTRFRAVDGETQDDQARLWASLDLLPQRLQLQAQLNYDLDDSFLQQQRYVVGYTSQCYAFRLEAREFRVGDQRDRDYRFSLSLKNVGTFLDLSGRQSTADEL